MGDDILQLSFPIIPSIMQVMDISARSRIETLNAVAVRETTQQQKTFRFKEVLDAARLARMSGIQLKTWRPISSYISCKHSALLELL